MSDKIKNYTYKLPDQMDELEFAKLTWEEYKYRHEFCWNLMSRITLITTTLSILPYLDKDFTEKAKALVIFTPLIGILFAILGSLRLHRELKLLDRIRGLYRKFQNTLVIPELKIKSTFTLEAMIYILLLTSLSIFNFILVLL